MFEEQDEIIEKGIRESTNSHHATTGELLHMLGMLGLELVRSGSVLNC